MEPPARTAHVHTRADGCTCAPRAIMHVSTQEGESSGAAGEDCTRSPQRVCMPWGARQATGNRHLRWPQGGRDQAACRSPGAAALEAWAD